VNLVARVGAVLLILGSTAVSVVTGVPLVAYVGCPVGYALGHVAATRRERRAAARR
jgi:hypothetical protein